MYKQLSASRWFLLQRFVCVVLLELSVYEGSNNLRRDWDSFSIIHCTHSDLLLLLTLLHTYLEFKSGEMSCATEKSFLPLKDPRFFCIVIVWMCCLFLHVLGFKSTETWCWCWNWCIIGNLWSSALNRIDHRAEKWLKKLLFQQHCRPIIEQCSYKTV